MTRRELLKRGAGLLGAAIAVPTIIPASALGRGGVLPPSERVAMGFIGVGGQGGGHLLGGAWTYLTGGYTARPDVQILAACDVWRDRRETATQRVNQYYAENRPAAANSCKAYTDFREVLARPDIDAVLIATPAHWHATMAVMAAEAGKDVYCEKPTACTIAESQAMLRAMRRHGRVFQAGTQQRSEYNGYFRRACEYVRSGRIGQLKEVYAWRDGGFITWPTRFYGPGQPIPAEFDWDLYLGPAPELPYDGNWSSHRFDLGELNWGQHHYDIIQWTCGMDHSGPVEVFLEEGRSNYRYANGVTVWGKAYPGEAIGGDGGACFVGTEGRIAVDRSSIVSYPGTIIREPLRPDEFHAYHAESHSGNFLECVRTRKHPICDIDIAHGSVSAVILGGMAKYLGRGFKWDPVAEQCINDDEANRLLSLTKRPPWQVC